MSCKPEQDLPPFFNDCSIICYPEVPSIYALQHKLLEIKKVSIIDYNIIEI
jgi:hypothetical protein